MHRASPLSLLCFSLLGNTLGCELIASVDRSQIAGSGGAGASSTASSTSDGSSSGGSGGGGGSTCTGTLQFSGSSVAASGRPTFVLAQDLNGDGRPDLATANEHGSTVSVLLNTCVP